MCFDLGQARKKRTQNLADRLDSPLGDTNVTGSTKAICKSESYQKAREVSPRSPLSQPTTDGKCHGSNGQCQQSTGRPGHRSISDSPRLPSSLLHGLSMSAPCVLHELSMSTWRTHGKDLEQVSSGHGAGRLEPERTSTACPAAIKNGSPQASVP